MPRIYVNGDSVSYGYWDAAAGGWANRLQVDVMGKRGYQHEVKNFALGGQTLAEVVNRFPDQLASYKSRARSLGVFMLGGTDSVILPGVTEPRNPLENFKRQLPELGRILVAARVTPIFVGLYPVNEELARNTKGESYSVEEGAKYTRAVEEYAESIDAPYVDIGSTWPYPGDDSVLSFDGFHPSDEGHDLIARQVIPVVQARLDEPLLDYRRGV